MKKSDLKQKTMSTRKPKKKARIGGRKEKKRYDWIAIFFEEIIH